MEKNGMVTTNSQSDYNTKKAEYYDEEGVNIADRDNKHKLKKPVKIVKDTHQDYTNRLSQAPQ